MSLLWKVDENQRVENPLSGQPWTFDGLNA